MFVFKCGLLILPSSYILSICSQITHRTRIMEMGLGLLYLASGAIAGKIIYDRYQHINILGSLTVNPTVTSFANKIASFSATSMFCGFLVHLTVFLFKVDNFSLTALNIMICAFGTLYMWMQGLVTLYVSSLYYNRTVTVLRQLLASVGSLGLVIMAALSVVAIFLPRGPSALNGAHMCIYLTFLCGYVLAAIFGVYILSFEKDYTYFVQGVWSDEVLDNECSYSEASVTDSNGSEASDLRTPIIVKNSNKTKSS